MWFEYCQLHVRAASRNTRSRRYSRASDASPAFASTADTGTYSCAANTSADDRHDAEHNDIYFDFYDYEAGYCREHQHLCSHARYTD